jgi:hypothetical protein
MIYVLNKIRIPTHGVKLGRHGLRMEERTHKSPMGPSQGKERRGGGRKRGGKRKKGRRPIFRRSHAISFDVTESRQTG